MDTDELKVSTTDLMGPKIAGLQQFAVILAIAGLVLTGSSVAMGVDAHQFYASWLIGWLLFFGVSAGSLGLLLLHHTVGGGWGFVLRRMWETACNPVMLFVMALLFSFLGGPSGATVGAGFLLGGVGIVMVVAMPMFR